MVLTNNPYSKPKKKELKSHSSTSGNTADELLQKRKVAMGTVDKKPEIGDASKMGPAKLNGTSGVKTPYGQGEELIGAKGYSKDQVGLPGVNLIRKPGAFGADKTKEEAPVDTTLPEIDETLPTTEGTGKVGVGGDTGVGGEDIHSWDSNNDGKLDPDELKGQYKTFYDNLDDNGKRKFLAEGEIAQKNNQNIADFYSNYIRDYNTNKTRLEENEAYRLKQEEISGEYKGIQESQTIRRAKDGVKKLKQSIAYLGDLGMPGKSSQRAVSIENQVVEAETSIRELHRLQSLAKKSRTLGNEKNAQQFEREMEDITTKLNDNVDKSIQDAFNGLIEADNNGKLDTVEELTAFREKMYNDLDASITGFSDASIQQIQFLHNEAGNVLKEKEAYEKNEGQINEDLSSIEGFYYNMNNKPMYDSTGGKIKIPTPEKGIPEGYVEEMVGNKLFRSKLDENGELMFDENGEGIMTSTNLIDDPTFSQQAMNVLAKQYANGTLDIKELQSAGLGQEQINSIIEKSGGIKETSEDDKIPKIEKIGTDENLEPIYGTWNPTTRKYEPIEVMNGATLDAQGNVDYSTLDFSTNSGLINKYPNEASFKNNNPTGITFGASSELEQMWKDAGVKFGKGTERPVAEGGNYYKFNSVQDGLDAYAIGLTQRGDDVYDRLVKWVGTSEGDSYAKGIMAQSGINKGDKFSELSEDQLSNLMASQLQKESPNYYNELASIPSTEEVAEPEYNKSKLSEYTKYVEDGKVPTGLKQGTKRYKDFISAAQSGYLDTKNEAFKAKGFNIANPDAFIGTSKKQKEAIAEAVNNVAPFIQSMDKIIIMAEEYGTETTLSGAGKKMNQEVRNAQLIAKEIYNLGVLNGPDLSLMEAIIANPTSAGANVQLWVDYVALLKSGKKTIVDNALAKAESVGLEFTGDTGEVSTEEHTAGSYKQFLPEEVAGDKKEGTSFAQKITSFGSSAFRSEDNPLELGIAGKDNDPLQLFYK